MQLSQHVSVGGHSTKHNLDNSYRATLEHVSPDLSEQNMTLRSDSLKSVYAELFGDAVKEYNAKQKRKDRKIEDYYEHVREDARGRKGAQNKDGKRLAYEQVVGVGNRDTFHASNPENVALAKKIYGDYVTEFEKRFPHLRVFESVIHVDEHEGGIHLHHAYVPWGEGYKRGMTRQQSLSKACENMGFSHMELDGKCREILQEVCAKHGVERLDMENHEHHKPTPQYKREQRELEQIRYEKEAEKDAHYRQRKAIAAKRNAVKREMPILNARRAVLKKRTASLSAKNRNAAAELANAKSSIESSERIIGLLHSSLIEKSKELEEKTVAAERLESAIELRSQLEAKAMEKASEAVARMRDAEAKASEAQETIDSLESRISDLEREIGTLEKRKGILETAIEKLKDSFIELRNSMSKWMPEPLRQLARLWRDNDFDGIEAWHNDMDDFAKDVIPELPGRLSEAIENAVLASRDQSYGGHRDRDDWIR